ncbi:MAG: DUF4124 domain-containing protein [Smithellaceae bacterium]|nr:DUF4124 domain-containing protein [Smithellaceae bacterium]
MKTLIVAFAILLISSFPVLADEFYVWQDEKGVVHITDQPPSHVGEKYREYYFPPTPLSASIPPSEEKEIKTPPSEQSERQREEAERKTEVEEAKAKLEKEIEEARRDYEEAKSHEDEYRFRMNFYYGLGYKWEYWKQKLDDIEAKRRRLEELEKANKEANEEGQ